MSMDDYQRPLQSPGYTVNCRELEKAHLERIHLASTDSEVGCRGISRTETMLLRE